MGFPMAGRSIQMSIASVLFIVILSFANVCNGFYLPGSYLQTYPNLEPNLVVVLGESCMEGDLVWDIAGILLFELI